MKSRSRNGVVGIASWALVCAALVAPSLAGPAHATESKSKRRQPQAAATSSSTHKRKSHRRHHYYRRQIGQKAPTADRIKDIQSALAREGFYQGQPTGKMDATTVDSLEKFQSAHGLDASGKLDAPTLQKMGLGSDVAGVSPPKPPPPPSCCSVSSSAPKSTMNGGAVTASNSSPAPPDRKASATSSSSPGNALPPSNSTPATSSHATNPN